MYVKILKTKKCNNTRFTLTYNKYKELISLKYYENFYE